MKEVPVEEFSREAAALVDAAQRERILITRNGKPLAVVVGIEHKDEEDFRLEAAPEFCRMIEERRKEPTIPLAQLKAELLAEEG